jgi:hypothetical protein
MPGSATSTTRSKPGTLLTYASLRFTGDALEPNWISDLLGTEPKTAYRKGEVYKVSRGHEVRGRTGLWRLSSKGAVDSADLNEHLAYLLAILFPANSEELVDRLRALMHDKGIEADVSCFWYGEHGAQPPVVPEDFRASFARLPATIETDFDTD